MKFLFIIGILIVALSGCDNDQASRDKLGKQTSRLFQIYLNGGRADARRAAQEAIRLIENTRFPTSMGEQQAFAVFLGYARLYAIDRRASSNNLAQIDLVKARYWGLRTQELHGDSPQGCLTYISKVATEDTLMDYIDGWDKGANEGKPPKYIASP